MKTLLLKLKLIKIKSTLLLLYICLFSILCHNLYQLVIYKNVLSALSVGMIIGMFFSYLAYYPLLQSVQRDRDTKNNLIIEFTHSCIKCHKRIQDDLTRDKALILQLETKIDSFNKLYEVTNENIKNKTKDETINTTQ